MPAWKPPARCKRHLAVPWLVLPVSRAKRRCAYRALASAADPAMLDGTTENYSSSSNSSSSSGNSNNKGGVVDNDIETNRNTTGDSDDITTASITDNIDNIITPARQKRFHQQSTLCVLDDPLTALDAETRDHIVQRCIHGLLRRIPGVAVVMTCGEIDENKSENNLLSNQTIHPTLPHLLGFRFLP